VVLMRIQVLEDVTPGRLVYSYRCFWGHAVALQAGRPPVRSPMVSLECFIDIILPAAVWPWGRLSL